MWRFTLVLDTNSWEFPLAGVDIAGLLSDLLSHYLTVGLEWFLYIHLLCVAQGSKGKWQIPLKVVPVYWGFIQHLLSAGCAPGARDDFIYSYWGPWPLSRYSVTGKLIFDCVSRL